MQYLNFLIMGLMIVTVFFLICLFLSWAGTRIWCKPKRQAWDKLPEDFNLNSEAVGFFSHQVQIYGRFIPAESKGQTKRTIILAHGWSHNGSRMLPLAHALNKAGYSILVYDARGHGTSGSDGPITIRKIAQDIIAAVDYLDANMDSEVQWLGLFGHSIGGSASILAASIEPRIKAVISSSGFSDPSKLTRETLQKMHVSFFPFDWLIFYFLKRYLGTSVEEVSPAKAIQKIQVPAMLIHGDSDNYIPPSNLDILYDHSNSDKTKRMIIPGRHHSDLLEDVFVMDEIVGFFNSALPSNSKTDMTNQLENTSNLVTVN